MRLLRFALAFLFVAGLSASAQAQTSRTVSRTFELASTGSVSLSAYKGHVDVQTAETDSVRVEVRIEADEQELVDQTRIQFDASPEHLDIETDYDEIEENQKLFGLFSFGSVTRPATDYTVILPRAAALSVETYSASTQVSSLDGDLQFDAYSADLTVDRTGGSLHADTYSGDVRVDRGEGSITVETYSGDLRADSLSGPVTFTSYSGSATLGFTGLAEGSRFDTYSGDVALALPEGAGAVVETPDDAFESEIPVRTERIDDDRLRAIVGEGGPTFRFDAFSGTLTLRRR